MIKLLDILKEILDDSIQQLDSSLVDSVKFYHGTTGFEIKNATDLDPLFRQKDTYKKKQAGAARRNHGSSQSGTGIYFGRTPDKHGTEDAMQYLQKKGRSVYFTRGSMYEMILKPGSKVVYYSGYGGFALISQSEYQKLREKGIDAVSENEDGGALNLINPDAVMSWKEVDKWEQPFDVYLVKYNEETNIDDRIEAKRFWEWNEFEAYVKEHLGDSVRGTGANGGPGIIESGDLNNPKSIEVKRPEL